MTWAASKQGNLSLRTYSEHGADLILYDSFFAPSTADQLLNSLTKTINWTQNNITLFGKTHLEPRLTAWYGDPDISYTYSGIKNIATPWTQELLEIKTDIEQIAGLKFNSVLLNMYRDGNDSMGWHQDNEKSLGKNPIIASVSLGGARRFKLKHISKNLKTECTLTHGSLLVMQGETQHFWKHHIPKTKRAIEPRINLTFRRIICD